jgi:hypothetical protein
MTNDVSPRWPRRLPVWRFLALGAALVCGFFVIRAVAQQTDRSAQRAMQVSTPRPLQ